jgi:hypothetical protein
MKYTGMQVFQSQALGDVDALWEQSLLFWGQS